MYLGKYWKSSRVLKYYDSSCHIRKILTCPVVSEIILMNPWDSRRILKSAEEPGTILKNALKDSEGSSGILQNPKIFEEKGWIIMNNPEYFWIIPENPETFRRIVSNPEETESTLKNSEESGELGRFLKNLEKSGRILKNPESLNNPKCQAGSARSLWNRLDTE